MKKRSRDTVSNSRTSRTALSDGKEECAAQPSPAQQTVATCQHDPTTTQKITLIISTRDIVSLHSHLASTRSLASLVSLLLLQLLPFASLSSLCCFPRPPSTPLRFSRRPRSRSRRGLRATVASCSPPRAVGRGTPGSRTSPSTTTGVSVCSVRLGRKEEGREGGREGRRVTSRPFFSTNTPSRTPHACSAQPRQCRITAEARPTPRPAPASPTLRGSRRRSPTSGTSFGGTPVAVSAGWVAYFVSFDYARRCCGLALIHQHPNCFNLNRILSVRAGHATTSRTAGSVRSPRRSQRHTPLAATSRSISTSQARRELRGGRGVLERKGGLWEIFLAGRRLRN